MSRYKNIAAEPDDFERFTELKRQHAHLIQKDLSNPKFMKILLDRFEANELHKDLLKRRTP